MVRYYSLGLMSAIADSSYPRTVGEGMLMVFQRYRWLPEIVLNATCANDGIEDWSRQKPVRRVWYVCKMKLEDSFWIVACDISKEC